MRPLLYVGILIALAGCSIPYEGKSFKARPPQEHKLEGEEGHGEGHVVKHEGGEHEAEQVPDATVYAPNPAIPTNPVFPATTPPSGRAASARPVGEATNGE